MSTDRSSRLRGADESTVRRLRETGDPLAGTVGFAGRLDDELVRDVLGRQPLFVDADASDPTADDEWSFDRTELDDPESVPAGHTISANGSTAVWSLPAPSPVAGSDSVVAGSDSAVDAVRTAVRASVDRFAGVDRPASVDRLATEDFVTDDLAIAFSGGVDSAIIAALTDAPLYVAGFPDSHDVDAARSAAEVMDRDLTVVELTHDDIVDAVPRITTATGRRNAMDVSIAIPLLLTAEQAAADGRKTIAVGQGADELFGGYAKVAKAPTDPRVEANSVRGARRETLEGIADQLERDVLTIRSAGIEPVAPYLHDEVVSAGLELPGDALVTDDGVRKLALRTAASQWLPEEILLREKKAMQYGTLVSRELDRLARQDGFKRRMDDHVGQYIDSLCADSE